MTDIRLDSDDSMDQDDDCAEISPSTKMDTAKIEQAVLMILEAIGEQPDRDGLRDTPRRVARMFCEIFAGLHTDLTHVLSARFHTSHEEIVVVKEIPFYSMCEHHLLPFFGKAHIAYLPQSGVVAGLSKLARLVDASAKRPQVQERMTDEIAHVLADGIQAQGVMVVIQAEHLCMNMRGIKKPGSSTVTMTTLGRIATEPTLRREVLHLIHS